MPTEYMNWFQSQLHDVLVPGGVLVWIEQQWDCQTRAFIELKAALEYCLNQKGMTLNSASSLGTVISDSGFFNLVGDMWRCETVALRQDGQCVSSSGVAAKYHGARHRLVR